MAFVRNERKGPVVIGDALPGNKSLKLGRPGTRRGIVEIEKPSPAITQAQKVGLIKIFESRAKAEAPSKPKAKPKPKAEPKPEAPPKGEPEGKK